MIDIVTKVLLVLGVENIEKERYATRISMSLLYSGQVKLITLYQVNYHAFDPLYCIHLGTMNIYTVYGMIMWLCPWNYSEMEN